MSSQKLGLVLSGGGARGAYQAGVLRAIYEIGKFKQSPFQIITGVSAGSINGMALAAGAHEFDVATQLIWDTWLNLRVHKIFKTDAASLFKTLSAWLTNFAAGRTVCKNCVTHLLNTAPLRELLLNNIHTPLIADNLRKGLIYGVALSATHYRTGKCVTFYDGDPRIQDWDRDSGLGRRAEITIDHIMASTAIPVFFPPVRIEHADYGDGGIAQNAPLSPVIRLGSDRILVIGLEHPPGHDEASPIHVPEPPVTLGDIAGTLLDALFLKSLDLDVVRLNQTNQLLSAFSPGQLKEDFQLRQVPALFIRPSKDLGKIDMDQFSRFPLLLRHGLKGLGITDFRAWDLLSYLAFEQDYAEALLELGYQDGMAAEEEIREFFELPTGNYASPDRKFLDSQSSALLPSESRIQANSSFS